MIHAPPGEADVGSDSLLHRGGLVVGMYESLRKCALYPTDDVGDAWRDVEVRFLWCLKSVWDVPYAMMRLREELEAAKDQGTPVRNVNIVRVEGNHFVCSSKRIDDTVILTLYLIGALGRAGVIDARISRNGCGGSSALT